MPQVSRFYGIVITMYFGDHAPPHFHAQYGAERAVYAIDPVTCIRGSLSRRADALVREWASLHQHELNANWEQASRLEPIEAIQPLD